MSKGKLLAEGTGIILKIIEKDFDVTKKDWPVILTKTKIIHGPGSANLWPEI